MIDAMMSGSSRPFSLSTLATMAAAVSAAILLDWVTGPMATPLFGYLAAVVVVAMHSGRKAGWLCAVAAVIAWQALSEREVTLLALAWNGMTRLAVLAIAASVTAWISDRSLDLPV